MMKKTLRGKKLFASILAIIMVAALVLGCVGCGKDTGTDINNDNSNQDNNNTNTDKYAGLSDAEYFQALAADELNMTVDKLAAAVGDYVEMAGSAGDFGASAELELLLGDTVLDLLGTYVASFMGEEMDLSFLSEIDLSTEIDVTSDLTQLKLGLGLSETQIIALSLIMSDETLWAGAPGLSDTFLEVDMAGMGVTADTAQTEMLTDLLAALPEEKEIDTILTRYIALALKEIDKVERTQTTLELDGLKQDVTQLNVKIDEADTLDMAKAVLTAAKDDQSIKTIVNGFAPVYNDMCRDQDPTWEDVDLYAEFVKAVEGALNSIPAEAETDSYIGLVLYVDDSHDIIGISYTSPEATTAAYTCYTVTEGENFKSILEICADEEVMLAVTGSGTNKKGTINGKFDVAFMGTSYLTAELKDFIIEWESVVGKIVLTPTEDLMEMLSQSMGAIATLDDIALELEFLIEDGLFGVAVDLVGKDAIIVGLAFKMADRAAEEIEKPSNSVSALDQEALMTWVAGLDVSSVFTNLRDAGVPETLVATLEGMAMMLGL